MNNIKRLIILIATMLLTVLTITLGGKFYVSKNARKSVEYGGGVEYVVRIESTSKNNLANREEFAETVANEIYKRIDPLGIKGALSSAENSKDFSRVRVTYPGIKNDDEKRRIEKLITNKPKLIFTDFFGNPLFTSKGNFNKSLLARSNLRLESKDYSYIESIKKSFVPISSKGASALHQNNQNKVAINLIPNKSVEWTEATKYIKELPKGANRVLVWLDLEGFIHEMKTNFPGIWAEAKGDPYKAAHIQSGKTSVKRKYTIDASKYLVSDASVNSVLSGNSFVIEGNFNNVEVKELANEINYGASNYYLKTEYSNYIKASYGSSAFNKAIIAGVIVFILIAIFLIVNYGLLGALSTISISLYMFITLTLFTVMRGEYSPESIAALIIGVGMAVDANIITFERLKSEIYAGSSLQKSYKDSNKKSISTIMDANITTLIVAFVLFFFGTRNIIGLSVTLILSIILTLVVMLGFTRLMSSLIIKSKKFDNKMHWLGVRPKLDVKIQNGINKFDYVKSSKWFLLGSTTIFGISLIVLTVFAAVANDFSGGFNLSQDFTGGSVFQMVPDSGSTGTFLEKDIFAFTDKLEKNGVGISNILTEGSNGQFSSVKIITDQTFPPINFKDLLVGEAIQSTTTTSVARELLTNALISIAVAIGAIIIYTLIRFKWTYSVAAIIAIIHDAIIVTGAFVITRIEISPVFIAGLLSIIGYSINDTIVTFDRIREKMSIIKGDADKKTINKVANEAIRETMKRSILTSLTTIISVIVLMSFGNATKLSFNFAMLIGLVAGTYSSIFIATYIWTKLEAYRFAKIRKRKNNNFWKIDDVEEQIFDGINDFKV